MMFALTTSSAVITDVDNFRVVANVSNTGSETLHLLRDPRSPLSQAPTESFSVINSKGARAVFSGIRVRYNPQAAIQAGHAENFVELKPGESISVEHDLAGVYNLTSTGVGAYTLDAADLFRVVDSNGTLSDIFANIESSKVNIRGKLVSLKNLVASPDNILSKRVEYAGCSAAQRSQIASAVSTSYNYAKNSFDHLTRYPRGSPRETRWFGTWSAGRHLLLLDSFSRLRAYPNTWTYNCNSCTHSGWYAFVYPSRYGTVYLCAQFWRAPATGAGSRADTIIHEGTHFPEVLRTKDYQYGQSNCLALARSNPALAVYHADNHTFFSVNA